MSCTLKRRERISCNGHNFSHYYYYYLRVTNLVENVTTYYAFLTLNGEEYLEE